MQIGDEVIALADIGGWTREHVSKGTRGVITKAGLGGAAVSFTVSGFLKDRVVTLDVQSDEITRT